MYHMTVGDSVLVRATNNRPVATVIGGRYQILYAGGEMQDEVRKYCEEHGWKEQESAQAKETVNKYFHRGIDEGYLIHDDKSKKIVALVKKNGEIQALDGNAKNPDVRLYCINNGLCSK